jgi:hypothetical protein
MSPDLVNSVWTFMRDGELYSPEDLANSSLLPTDLVTRVLEFLTRYGFAEMVVKHQPLYRKSADVPDPGDSLTFLQTIIADQSLRDVEATT